MIIIIYIRKINIYICQMVNILLHYKKLYKSVFNYIILNEINIWKNKVIIYI